MEYIGFHDVDKEYGYLSNWFLSKMVVNGVIYTSVEQYMMHKKAILFGDYQIATKIMDTNDPAEIQQLGRQVKYFDDKEWELKRPVVLLEGLLAKFSQNDKLKVGLICTGDAILMECAHKDLIFGIGYGVDDVERLDPSKWKGKNLLGYGLMYTREILKK